MRKDRYELLKSLLDDGMLTADVETGKVIKKDGKEATKVGAYGYIPVYVPLAPYKRTAFGAHEVIAVAMGLDLVDKVVNHIDGNKTNNRADNLEVVTHAENLQHAYDTGLRKSTKGKPGKRKLTLEQEQEIRESKEPASTLAFKYGVSDTKIRSLKKNN